jgi:hypothetical protein
MKNVEGIGTIPATRWSQVCRICKDIGGACVGCHICHDNGSIAPDNLFSTLLIWYSTVHVGCAHRAGWTMGFEIQPVKSTRRDLVNIVKLGNETGNMTAAIWCPNHDVKSVIHTIDEISETGQVGRENP